MGGRATGSPAVLRAQDLAPAGLVVGVDPCAAALPELLLLRPKPIGGGLLPLPHRRAALLHGAVLRAKPSLDLLLLLLLQPPAVELALLARNLSPLELQLLLPAGKAPLPHVEFLHLHFPLPAHLPFPLQGFLFCLVLLSLFPLFLPRLLLPLFLPPELLGAPLRLAQQRFLRQGFAY